MDKQFYDEDMALSNEVIIYGEVKNLIIWILLLLCYPGY